MDLSDLMRSEALGLEPPAGLAAAVRRRARRQRRQRTAGAALAVAGVAGAALLLPGALGSSRPQQDLAADRPETYGITSATSDVVLLEQLNGGVVVAYFEDGELCTAAVRVKRVRTCAVSVSSTTPDPLPVLFPADAPSLRVDDRQLLAGLAGPAVDRVRVRVRDGEPLVAPLADGRGFPLRVFHVEVPAGADVSAVDVLDAGGDVLASRRLR